MAGSFGKLRGSSIAWIMSLSFKKFSEKYFLFSRLTLQIKNKRNLAERKMLNICNTPSESKSPTEVGAAGVPSSTANSQTRTTIDDIMETLRKLEDETDPRNKDRVPGPLDWCMYRQIIVKIINCSLIGLKCTEFLRNNLFWTGLLLVPSLFLFLIFFIPVDELESKKEPENDGMRLSKDTLLRLDSSKDNVLKSGFLSDEKLSSIMNYLEKVEADDRLADIDQVVVLTCGGRLFYIHCGRSFPLIMNE